MSSIHNNVNVCALSFCDHLVDVTNLQCPLKTEAIYHNKVPYMDAELRKLQCQHNIARNLKNTNPIPEYSECYTILWNKYVKSRLSSQRKYF